MVSRTSSPTPVKRRARVTAVVVPALALVLSGCGQDPGVVPGEPDHCVLICAVVRSITGEPERPPEAPPPPSLAKPKRTAKSRPGRVQAPREASGRSMNHQALRGELGTTPAAVSPPVSQTFEPKFPSPAAPALGPIPGSVAIDPDPSQFVPRAPSN